MKDYNLVKVSKIAKIILGGTPKRSEEAYWGGEIKWASAKDITSVNTRYIYDTEERITELGLKESNTKLLPKDTIVITARGTVGAMAMLSEDMAFNQSCYGLISKDGIDPDYLFYALKASLSKISTVSYGTVFDTITMKSFDSIEIPVPSIEEQKRIAHILGTLDDKIELNQRMNETLEAIARAIFKSWFVDFDPVRAKMAGKPYPLPDAVMALFPDEMVESELGMIPKGWEVGKLGDFIKIFDSERIPLSRREREKRKGDYPYYGATKIIDYIDDFIFDGIYVLMGEDGSVITEKGYPVLQYVWGKFWANNHAHVLQGINGFSTEFLYLLLSFTNISPYVTGAVQLKLNQKNMRSISIVVPSEQTLSSFDTYIQTNFNSKRNNLEEFKTLKKIRDILILTMMRGDIKGMI
jgi:type I restriction enzyme S subunit